jgi:hypothetical protein
VHSPDSLRGTIDVSDNEGIDSMWLRVDTSQVGVDGQFDLSYEAPFLFPVASGIVSGAKIPVSLRARDVAGYSDVLDTFVVVK